MPVTRASSARFTPCPCRCWSWRLQRLQRLREQWSRLQEARGARLHGRVQSPPPPWAQRCGGLHCRTTLHKLRDHPAQAQRISDTAITQLHAGYAGWLAPGTHPVAHWEKNLFAALLLQPCWPPLSTQIHELWQDMASMVTT